MTTESVVNGGPAARERILSAAYDLFTRRGIRSVGIDEVIAQASVAKATLYKHFRSKDELVLAFLARREEIWTIGLVQSESQARGTTPEEQLLAIFDVFDEWFRSPEQFEGCSFINVLLEMGSAHPAGRASIHYLANIRQIVEEQAEQAGLADPAGFARSFHILLKGSIVTAAEGDLDAAEQAKEMARALLARHRARIEGAVDGR